MVTPVTNVENTLTATVGLDSSQSSWSSLELDGLLSPQPSSPILSTQPSSPILFSQPSSPILFSQPSSPILSPQPSFSTPPTVVSSPPINSLSPPTAPSPLAPPISPPIPAPAFPQPSSGLTSKALKRKIQRGVQERVNDFWKEKVGRYVMQGDYLALLMEEGESITWKSFMWDIPQGVLKFALNAGVNTLPSLDNLKRWGKRVSDRCPFCGNIQTLAHVLSNCSTALNQGRLTWRHYSVLTSMINLIRPHLKPGMILYSDMPGYQAPHGGTIPPHILVTSLKPDVFVFNSQSLEVIVLELTCPWDTNIARSHDFKQEKYAPLIADLSQSRIVSFFPVEVSARGQVTKENRSRLQSFIIKCCVNPKGIAKSLVRVSSKAALLSSFSIFSARGEPSWENPAPLTVC